MIKSGGKNRGGGRNRARPCKRRITPWKKGQANKTSDDSEQGRFFPGPFGWDLTKFPARLRPQEPPCYEETEVSNRPPVAEPSQPEVSDQDIEDAYMEARCRALLAAVREDDKAMANRPKPGDSQIPEWGWDVGKVIKTKDSSPGRRMREHNLKYQIQLCKKKQNKSKKSKTERYWTAPDYAQVGAAMSMSEDGSSGKTESTDDDGMAPGNNNDNGFSGGNLFGTLPANNNDKGSSGGNLFGSSPANNNDNGFSGGNLFGASSGMQWGKGSGSYVFHQTSAAASYANGGTAHAGKFGYKKFADKILPGPGKPPLRFLPWSEIFGYRPAKQHNRNQQSSNGPGWMKEN
ncbi:unnamed protein product [Orchesella dallaii]